MTAEPAARDPFAPPTAAISPGPAASEDFFAVFWRWEMYRIVYNAILCGETAFALATWGRPPTPATLAMLASYAVGANICFCAGPVLTGYCWRLNLRGRWVGLAILTAGTLFAMVLAGLFLQTLDPTRHVTFGIEFWS